MKPLTRWLLAGLALFPLLMLPNPTRAAPRRDIWTPGLYTGYVYFLAEADWQYRQSMEGMSAQIDGVKYYESHGEVDCAVSSEDGLGHCGVSFPMDITWSESGTVTMPGCSMMVSGYGRANAIDGGPPLAPLSNAPLGQGFSSGFFPVVGTESGALMASGCKNVNNPFQTTPGQPVWPRIDFHVEYHSALSMGGTCSMAGLPRSITVGPMSSSLSLQQCEWRVLFMDPYATFPEE